MVARHLTTLALGDYILAIASSKERISVAGHEEP
jgi:hypothetical protein